MGLYHHATFHDDWHVPWQKIGDSPVGLPSHVIHFWKAVVKPMLCPIWHVSLRQRDLLSRYSRSKFGILGPLEGTTMVWLFVRDSYLPSCKISHQWASPSPNRYKDTKNDWQQVVSQTKRVLALRLSMQSWEVAGDEKFLPLASWLEISTSLRWLCHMICDDVSELCVQQMTAAYGELLAKMDNSATFWLPSVLLLS